MKAFELDLFRYEWDFLSEGVYREGYKYLVGLWKRWSVVLFTNRGRDFWEYYRYRVVVGDRLGRYRLVIEDLVYYLYWEGGKVYGVRGEDVLGYFLKREMIGGRGSGVRYVA